MRNRCLLMSILALASSAMLATSSFAAEAGTTEHEGVSLKPQMLVQFRGFGITNSMLVTWLVAAGIIDPRKRKPFVLKKCIESDTGWSSNNGVVELLR